ncbi:hypothetical protein TNCV_627671 [Trichonephila clavipes]|nr:hypothetical protein TNCV_627671 [Trichonephila clavipes]
MRAVAKQMRGYTYTVRMPQWRKIHCFPTVYPPEVAAGRTGHCAPERVWFMHDGTPAHFSIALRYHPYDWTWWTHFLASTHSGPPSLVFLLLGWIT